MVCMPDTDSPEKLMVKLKTENRQLQSEIWSVTNEIISALKIYGGSRRVLEAKD